jgi:hypothetical protein
MDVVAEASFDLANTPDKMTLRIGRPYCDQADQNWCCTFELTRPLEVSRTIYGEYSLRALLLALKTASAYLYGSELYKDGQIGIFGEFGGYLNIPAPKEFADVAPCPF